MSTGRKFGYYPSAVLADRIYQTRANKLYCKELGIRLFGPPLGRRKADQTDAKIKRQMYCDSCERNAVEGRNGNAKRRFGLDRLFSKLDETAKTEATLILLAMNAYHRLVRWLVLFFLKLLSFFAWPAFSADPILDRFFHLGYFPNWIDIYLSGPYTHSVSGHGIKNDKRQEISKEVLLMHYPTFTTNILTVLFATAATLACFGHRLSVQLRRRVAERTPRNRIAVIGAGLRLRTGWTWQANQFEVTAQDCLRRRQGLSIGRGLLRHIQVYREPMGSRHSSVSRRHARLDFDEKHWKFYIEDTSSLNAVYWAPLTPNGSLPEYRQKLTDRKYLDEDLRLWLGEVFMELRLLEPDPAPQPDSRRGNIVAAVAVAVMQILALMLYFFWTESLSLPLFLPGILLAIAALSTLPRDCAFTPVPAMIFVALTCGWFLYAVCSPASPDDAAILVARSFFCIGAAVIYLLPDSSEEGGEGPCSRVSWYCKTGCAVLAIVVLYHYQIITTFNDSVLLLALVLSDRVCDRKKLFQKAP